MTQRETKYKTIHKTTRVIFHPTTENQCPSPYSGNPSSGIKIFLKRHDWISIYIYTDQKKCFQLSTFFKNSKTTWQVVPSLWNLKTVWAEQTSKSTIKKTKPFCKFQTKSIENWLHGSWNSWESREWQDFPKKSKSREMPPFSGLEGQ